MHDQSGTLRCFHGSPIVADARCAMMSSRSDFTSGKRTWAGLRLLVTLGPLLRFAR